MKTLLVALNAKYVHSSLSIRYLKAYSREQDVELFESTINEPSLKIATEILRREPRVIGFSCYIWNIEATLRVIKIIKEVRSDIIIVLGGPEVSYDGENYLIKYPFIDFIISGEGEISFNLLIRYLKGENIKPESISGLVYWDKYGELVSNPPELIKDLNLIPFPYDEGIPDRIIYYEATRGCPFSCKYCLSSTIKGLRYFDLERVKEELRIFIEAGVRIVKFVDRTFNANKSFAMAIWEFLIEEGKGTLFHFEIAADLLDDDAIDLLARAPRGLFQFEVGVQTTNPEILRNINRSMNFKAVKSNIIKIREMGNIHCHLDLIAGLPGENLNSFRKSFDMCMEIKPDVLQLGFLKILKGSPMYFEREKYDIHYEDSPPYQVLYTGSVSFDEMTDLRELEEVFETYYNSGIFQITISHLLESQASPFDFFMSFKRFLKIKGFFERKLDLKEKARLLLDFSEENIEEDFIKDLLLHDYIINTRKPNLPNFLINKSGVDLREKVHERRKNLEEILNIQDFKRVFYCPVGIKITREESEVNIKKSDGIVVFNLSNGKYTYI